LQSILVCAVHSASNEQKRALKGMCPRCGSRKSDVLTAATQRSGEGNGLHVDTMGISDRSWLDTAGHQQRDKLHVSEVFAKTGPDTITWTATFDDPVYFTKLWTISLEMKRQKYDIMEMICTDNNRDMPHYSANQALEPATLDSRLCKSDRLRR
jgi:hypothetical protein